MLQLLMICQLNSHDGNDLQIVF